MSQEGFKIFLSLLFSGKVDIELLFLPQILGRNHQHKNLGLEISLWKYFNYKSVS